MNSVEEKLTWYVAVLVVVCHVDDNATVDPLLELQFKLIKAKDAEEAYDRAMQLGKQEGCEYKNEEGEKVSWVFQGLHDLQEISSDTIEHGTEVFSRMMRKQSDSMLYQKEKLTVFWFEENKNRTAREILDGY
jgi:hypothetical protein